MIRLGVLLKNKRQEAGISQTEFCRRIGLKNGQYLSNIERGKSSIPLKYTVRLMQELNISKRELIDALQWDYFEKITKSIEKEINRGKTEEERTGAGATNSQHIGDTANRNTLPLTAGSNTNVDSRNDGSTATADSVGYGSETRQESIQQYQ